jgi:hypothetical protein
LAELRHLEKLTVFQSDNNIEQAYCKMVLQTSPHPTLTEMPTVICCTENLIEAIGKLLQPSLKSYIEQKTKDGRIDQSERWCDFRHFAGRLYSYYNAANVIMSTRQKFDQLFHDFDVESISSSQETENPLRKGNWTAGEIIGRMTAIPAEQATYRAYAEELQRCALDELINDGAKSCRPFVHCEIQLLDWLEKNGGTHESRFFNNWRYIGASIPTCRLCAYYFDAHGSGVQVRPTCGNTCHSWRVPFVYEYEGDGARKNRQKMLNSVLTRIRKDAFLALSDKVRQGKRYDTSTCLAMPPGSSVAVGEFDAPSDVMTKFGTMSIRGHPLVSQRPAVTHPPGDEGWRVAGELDVDHLEDVEEGGASLV